MDKDQEKLNELLVQNEIDANAADYQAVEIRFTDNDGKVKMKTAMFVKDMLALENLHDYDRTDTISMLFKAAEEQLRQAIEDDKLKVSK